MEETDAGRGQVTQLVIGEARAQTQVWLKTFACDSLWPASSKALLKFVRWKIILAPFKPPHTLLNKNCIYPIMFIKYTFHVYFIK